LTPLATPERTYRADIDGMRALAILSVVLYHGGFPRLTGGFTGVDIFFVISGYLIGGHIYAELRAGTFSYASFYRRRAKRILPAFFAVLVFVLLAAITLLSPIQAAQVGREACAAVLSDSNILYWATTNYFTGRSDHDLLLMTWSLGVEEQFYAVIPVLMLLLARARHSLMLPAIGAACVLSFALAWIALGSHPMMVFYMLPARAWELGIGVALAVFELNRKRLVLPAGLTHAAGAAGLLLMLAPMLTLTAETAFPGASALPSVLGAAMVIAVPGSFVNTRLLSLAPLTFIGRISYSCYLWHWPLLALVHIIYGGSPPAAALLCAVAASFAAAAISCFAVEQPLRKSDSAPAPLLMRYAVLAAAMLLAGAALWLSHGIPQRLPELAAIESPAQALEADPCLAGMSREQPDLTSRCYDAAAPTIVALWGDSHAAALAPALRTAAAAQGYGFSEMAKASCPPLRGATHAIPRLPLLAAGCQGFNGVVARQIESDSRIRVVILSAGWAAPLYRTWQDGWLTADPSRALAMPAVEANRQLFVASLNATIEFLQAAGKQVVVIADVPSFTVDPLWRIDTQQIPARRFLAAWLRIPDGADPGVAAPDAAPEIVLSNSLLHQAVAGFTGVALIDPAAALCESPTQCAYREGDYLFYIDSNHLSADGARQALREFSLPSTNAAPAR